MEKLPLAQPEMIAKVRKLAKYATLMDSIITVPFIRKGFGLDSLLSTVPVAGDVAGLALTVYTFKQARDMGVPLNKLKPAITLALMDAVVGTVPIAGTVLDVFMRPSHKTLEIVREHLREVYGIDDITDANS